MVWCGAISASTSPTPIPAASSVATSTRWPGCLVIEWEHFQRHLNTSDVGRIILDMEKKLEAVEGPPPIRIMDCDPCLMSDLYGMFGLKFEPAYKINSGMAMLNRLRSRRARREGAGPPALHQSKVPATDRRVQLASRPIICGPNAPGISI